MASNEEWAYLAGLWEGEGSAGYSSKGIGVKKALLVSVANTNHDVLYWIKDTVGYGFVNPRRTVDTWDWRVRNEKARVFLRSILPYMQFRRELALSLV